MLKLLNFIKPKTIQSVIQNWVNTLSITSAQIGKREEAIDNYNVTISLTSPSSTLGKYAKKGALCLTDETACLEKAAFTVNDEIFGKNFDGVDSENVKSEFEKLKIENLMRDINRGKDIPADEFKEYRDFSNKLKSSAPTNDEIVTALRTLQNAGFGNLFNNSYSDLSMLTGSQDNNFTNSLMGSNIDPRVMQALFTNNMSLGF